MKSMFLYGLPKNRRSPQIKAYHYILTLRRLQITIYLPQAHHRSLRTTAGHCIPASRSHFSI